MMDCSGSRVICDSCKHLFTEKDKIIDDLKRSLITQENRVKDLESEAKNVEKKFRNVVEGKSYITSKSLHYIDLHFYSTIYSINAMFKPFFCRFRCVV